MVGVRLDRERAKLRDADMDQADDHQDLQSDEARDLAQLSRQDPTTLTLA